MSASGDTYDYIVDGLYANHMAGMWRPHFLFSAAYVACDVLTQVSLRRFWHLAHQRIPNTQSRWPLLATCPVFWVRTDLQVIRYLVWQAPAFPWQSFTCLLLCASIWRTIQPQSCTYSPHHNSWHPFAPSMVWLCCCCEIHISYMHRICYSWILRHCTLARLFCIFRLTPSSVYVLCLLCMFVAPSSSPVVSAYRFSTIYMHGLRGHWIWMCYRWGRRCTSPNWLQHVAYPCEVLLIDDG